MVKLKCNYIINYWNGKGATAIYCSPIYRTENSKEWFKQIELFKKQYNIREERCRWMIIFRESRADIIFSFCTSDSGFNAWSNSEFFMKPFIVRQGFPLNISEDA